MYVSMGRFDTLQGSNVKKILQEIDDKVGRYVYIIFVLIPAN